MASAAARLLFLCGFPVAVLERAAPLAVRRLVSFAEAVRSGSAEVEGVGGRLTAAPDLVAALDRGGYVPVVVDAEGGCLALVRPGALVDARMAKRNLDTRLDQAPLVVALGPGFTAGVDAHAVIETQRGPDLGRVRWSGSAAADTARPAALEGETERRVLRAPRAGAFRPLCRIGDLVDQGALVGQVEGEPVRAAIAGLVRGLAAAGVLFSSGEKIGDVDPRGARVDPARISDKARAVAAGILEAVLVGLGRAGSGST